MRFLEGIFSAHLPWGNNHKTVSTSTVKKNELYPKSFGYEMSAENGFCVCNTVLKNDISWCTNEKWNEVKNHNHKGITHSNFSFCPQNNISKTMKINQKLIFDGS